MIFKISSDKLPKEAELRFVKVIYSDSHYEVMGYAEFDERQMKSVDVIIQLKNNLMKLFAKLENEEIEIFKNLGVDVTGKLNWKNFCDTEGSLMIG